ncbi:hypothetical protein KCU95_g960, partial [Aureobasidium melanogenum]
MSNHIDVPKEDDDKINRTLRENLPDNINEVDLGSKEQKGMYPLYPPPFPSLYYTPYPLYSPLFSPSPTLVLPPALPDILLTES